jgi:YD repeat-containing protein
MTLKLPLIILFHVLLLFNCLGQDLNETPKNELISRKHLQENKIKKRFIYKTDCEKLIKKLTEVETYDSLGHVIETKRYDNHTTHIYYYDNFGNLIEKHHFDSIGKLTKFNRIKYLRNKWITDTTYNADSTVYSCAFRHSNYRYKYDSISWALAPYKYSYNYVTLIKYDQNNFEIENSKPYHKFPSRYKFYYKNGLRILTEYFGTNEKTMTQLLVERQIDEYDSNSLPIKTIKYNAIEPKCQYYYSYEYEKQ